MIAVLAIAISFLATVIFVWVMATVFVVVIASLVAISCRLVGIFALGATNVF